MQKRHTSCVALWPIQAGNEPQPNRAERVDRDRGPGEGGTGGEPVVAVSGFLDLRDEGYGFLRVRGYLPSKEDVYVPA